MYFKRNADKNDENGRNPNIENETVSAHEKTELSTGLTHEDFATRRDVSVSRGRELRRDNNPRSTSRQGCKVPSPTPYSKTFPRWQISF